MRYASFPYAIENRKKRQENVWLCSDSEIANRPVVDMRKDMGGGGVEMVSKTPTQCNKKKERKTQVAGINAENAKK